jgi:hypothetical protein
MHLVEVLLMIWFLRKHGNLRWILCGYAALLIPCIFLLEQHYVVDVLAALPVAAVGIVMAEGTSQLRESFDRNVGTIFPFARSAVEHQPKVSATEKTPNALFGQSDSASPPDSRVCGD